MADLKEILERADRAVADIPLPAGGLDELERRRGRKHRNRRIRAGALGVVVALVIGLATVIAGFAQLDQAPTVPQRPPSPSVAPTVWTPLQERGTSVVFERRREDPADAPLGWIDIRRVTTSDYNAGAWTLELAAKPPRAIDLEPGRVITYGLVFDTTGDRVGDYVVGISNDAARDDLGGNFRVWVTDLATGESDETNGPGYGFPIEFRHAQADGSMLFTFLPGTEPADLNFRTVRFYAWASETRDGGVVAWDSAPDTGWMERP